jgi:hypothetical protein
MTKRRAPLTDEQREQRRAQQRELVLASIEQLRTSDGWQAYLKPGLDSRITPGATSCSSFTRGWLHTASFEGRGGHSVQSPPVIAVAPRVSWLLGSLVAGTGGRLDLLLPTRSAPVWGPTAGFLQPASRHLGGDAS